MLENLGVKTRFDGRFCGIVVKEEFAKRFVEGPEEERKVMEIRSRPVKFIDPGQKILLISVSGGHPRRLLGILEFGDCTKIPNARFDRYFGFHRVSKKEFAEFRASSAALSKQEHVFGYGLTCVHRFAESPVLRGRSHGEVWAWISQEDVALNVNEASLPRLPSGSQSDPSPQLAEKRKPSFSESSCDSVTMTPAAKVAKTEGCSEVSTSLALTCDEEEKGNDGDSDGDIEEDEDIDEDMSVEGDTLTCITLLHSEWVFISQTSQKDGSALLRPYNSAEKFLNVVVRQDEGHCLVGTIGLGDCVGHDMSKNKRMDNTLLDGIRTMYTSEQLEGMKRNKYVWRWPILEVMKLDHPVQFGYLDMNKKFRNRTFKISKSSILPRDHKCEAPKDMNLLGTARFFVQRMTDVTQLQLAQNVSKLAESQTCIHVATTCSGTDVCIKVLTETVKFLNEWKAGNNVSKLRAVFPYIPPLYIYIYLFIIFFSCRFINTLRFIVRRLAQARSPSSTQCHARKTRLSDRSFSGIIAWSTFLGMSWTFRMVKVSALCVIKFTRAMLKHSK